MWTKHPPIRLATERPHTVYLSTGTPFVSAVKRVERNLDKMVRKKQGRYVVVYGMGKAIQKALAVAMDLQQRGFKLNIYTRTRYALDETADFEKGEVLMAKRPVGLIELHVYPTSTNKNR